MLRAIGGFTPERKLGLEKAHQGQSILSQSESSVYDIEEQEYYGVKGFSGYVTIDQNTNNKVFFSYMMNKKGIKNAPVVIGNPGGPGF
jgi:pimeloyl-ACP methyl ester carboxylesterase